jgi:hypothetical protein
MPPVGFEPAVPASERSQTHALDRAATGIGPVNNLPENNLALKANRIELRYNVMKETVLCRYKRVLL